MRTALTQVHELISDAAASLPNAVALVQGNRRASYAELRDACHRFASGVASRQLPPGGRVGVFLPKQIDTVIALFGTSFAGGAFVPINPILKPAQVAHIVADCDIQILVTSQQRWAGLGETLKACPNLHTVVLSDGDASGATNGDRPALISWSTFVACESQKGHRRIGRDMAAILYTSGSTGKPRGVVLSHRNLIAGAESVCTYLCNTSNDRILAALPLSFDAGLSQLTTAFNAGATTVLMDYLLPRDVLEAIERHQISGLAAVPSLWNQLVRLDWPDRLGSSLRYISNTGGALPVATINRLSDRLPDTEIFLMYGLTEAFRSTFLPPSELARIPHSIGKAMPNTEILIINQQGEVCAAGEPGELVHRGDTVALGYWNDPVNTALRFRPTPGQDPALAVPELAVWSGDLVSRDEDGYLYFLARNDDMIKTSGYRVSPTEIEELAYAAAAVTGAVALGLPHPVLGQAILLIIADADDTGGTVKAISTRLKSDLPRYMHPLQIIMRESLPHNQNGKVDRRALRDEYQDLFAEDA